METMLKNLLLAGVGALAYSYEKATGVVNELIDRGALTLKQGQELNEELKRRMRPGPDRDGEHEGRGESLRDVLAGFDLATRVDLEAIKERLDRIERRLGPG